MIIGADLASSSRFCRSRFAPTVRHHQARVYVVTRDPVREDQYAAGSLRVGQGGEWEALESLRDQLKAEPELVILFGDAIKGEDVRRLVEFGESLGIPVKYVCLVDYSNSRGAVDMGLLPDLGRALSERSSMLDMLAATDLDVLWVVGANPLKQGGQRAQGAFLVVQDLFLTETAQVADVVLPAASAYEKNGTVTNVCGEVQRLKTGRASDGSEARSGDFRVHRARKWAAPNSACGLPMPCSPRSGRRFAGIMFHLPVIATGGAAQTAPLNGRIPVESRPELIPSAQRHSVHVGYFGAVFKDSEFGA